MSVTTRSGNTYQLFQPWQAFPKPKTATGALRLVVMGLSYTEMLPWNAIAAVVRRDSQWCKNVSSTITGWQSFDSPPRLEYTPTSKLREAIADIYTSERTLSDWLTPALLKSRLAQKGLTMPRRKALKKHLKALGLSLVTPKNVTNASNPVTKLKRVNNATKMVEMMQQMKNKLRNTFFIDESSCNLAKLRPSSVIRPTGRRAYRRWWKSQVIVSVTLQMCMRGDGTVLHYKFVRGGCDQTHALDFLKECSKKMSATQDNVIFWDNAPAHGPATKKFLELPEEQRRAVIIQTPPCTPDSNLVEYSFSSLKNSLRRGLEKEQLTNQSVDLWIDYCTTICHAWTQSRRASASTYHTVLNYLEFLLKAEGDLNVLDQLLRPNEWDKKFPDIHTKSSHDSPLSAEAHDDSAMSDE